MANNRGMDPRVANNGISNNHQMNSIVSKVQSNVIQAFGAHFDNTIMPYIKKSVSNLVDNTIKDKVNELKITLGDNFVTKKAFNDLSNNKLLYGNHKNPNGAITV